LQVGVSYAPIIAETKAARRFARQSRDLNRTAVGQARP
jgi:hypothetical protein